jgi:hypothetical protein
MSTPLRGPAIRCLQLPLRLAACSACKKFRCLPPPLPEVEGKDAATLQAEMESGMLCDGADLSGQHRALMLKPAF